MPSQISRRMRLGAGFPLHGQLNLSGGNDLKSEIFKLIAKSCFHSFFNEDFEITMVGVQRMHDGHKIAAIWPQLFRELSRRWPSNRCASFDVTVGNQLQRRSAKATSSRANRQEAGGVGSAHGRVREGSRALDGHLER